MENPTEELALSLPLLAAGVLGFIAVVVAIVAVVLARRAATAAEMATIAGEQHVNRIATLEQELRILRANLSRERDESAVQAKKASSAAETQKRDAGRGSGQTSNAPTQNAGQGARSSQTARPSQGPRTPQPFYLAGFNSTQWSVNDTLAAPTDKTVFLATPESPTRARLTLALGDRDRQQIATRPQDYPSPAFEVSVERSGGQLVETSAGVLTGDGRGNWKIVTPVKLIVK